MAAFLEILKAIPLKTYLWGFLVFTAVSYHYLDRARAVGDAVAEVKNNVVVGNLQAEIQYQDRWIDTQGMLSVLAASDRFDTFQLRQSYHHKAAQSKKEYRNVVQTLPATGCVIDAVRLRAFNETVSSPRRPAETL